MSIKSVKSAVQAAITKPKDEPQRVTLAEAKRIVAEAEKGIATTGEVNQVKGLVERAWSPGPMTEAVGEAPQDVFTIDDSARRHLVSFIQRNDPGYVPAAPVVGGGEPVAAGGGKLDGMIRTALKPDADGLRRLNVAETTKLVTQAEKGGVTQAERNALIELLQNGLDPGTVFTMAASEVPQDAYFIDEGSREAITDFLARSMTTPS